jgi:predicted RNA binding protein YcfA (HicA-like mRNA interferase family)
MPAKARDVKKALKSKGFTEGKSKDIRYIYYRTDGKKSRISTMISHSADEISENLLGKMSRQMEITRDDLELFVECTLTQLEYEKKVIGDISKEDK